MHRWVALVALTACEPTAPPPDPPQAAWLSLPGPSGFPLGELRGRLGRGQPPQPVVDLGIASAAGELAPLHLATPFAVPGDGPARAVLSGAEGDQRAVELVEVDAGRVVWRDRAACAAPVVGVTAEVIVCAGADGTRALGLDGKPRWRSPSPFVVLSAGRVVVADRGAAVVLDAATGDELARVALPGGLAPEAVVASCGGTGRELFASGDDGRLVRIGDTLAGAAIRWAVPLGAIVAIDACDATVLVTESGPAGPALVAIARATGKVTGRVDAIRGAWPARDGTDRIEVATALGIARYPRDLAGPPAQLGGPPLGELVASRGELRLVRATPSTAVLLDRQGVRAYLPLAALGAVLGDAALIATTWIGSPGETAHRVALPPRWNRALRLPGLGSGVALDAELRDLPAVRPLEPAGAVALPDTGMRGVIAHALDPADGAALYAIAIDREGQGAAVARADLAARRWRWQRVDGCGPGTPVAIAVARGVVVCGARGRRGAPATVRATSRDGAARWEHRADNVDGVIAGGDVVVVADADRATVLDARDGRVRGRLASDDGGAARVAVVALGDATLVVVAERGRIVARLGNGGLLPVWSIAVAGVVRALAPSGEGVLVALEDGDGYRIDARSAQVIALPGLGLAWHAPGPDVVTGQTAGGPIPGPAPPPARPPLAQLLRRPLQILRGEIDTPPPMSTPVKAPPPLGDSWQLTLYELGGGLRARNDYALPAPVGRPAPRGPPGSPLVVTYGPGQREVCVLDPRTGDPLRRVALPEDAAPGAVFGTVVDGTPVAGALLASPLRVVLF